MSIVFAPTSRSLTVAVRSASRLGMSILPRHTRLSSTMHDNDPELLHKEKMRNLTNTQHKTSTPHDHAPGWNEHLATASEASVKADRSDDTIADLQSKTVNYVKQRHDHEDSVQPTEALYSREEIDGPLGTAPGKHDETMMKRTVHETTEVVKEKS